MFKSICVTVVSLVFLTVTSAASRPLGYECAANGKKIIAHYSVGDKGGYVLDSLTIDGQDYQADTRLSVSRGSAEFFIENFRDGKPLMLKMGRENSYQLGKDGRSIKCCAIRFTPRQTSIQTINFKLIKGRVIDCHPRSGTLSTLVTVDCGRSDNVSQPSIWPPKERIQD